MFTYLLLVNLEKDISLKIGKKGYKEFRGGFYVYVGSGRRYGFQRIIRHLKISKKFKWHIDYLLECGKIEKIWIILGKGTDECHLSSLLEKYGIILVKKFGSSDCHCPSHLFYFKKNPSKEIENIIFQSILKNDCM